MEDNLPKIQERTPAQKLERQYRRDCQERKIGRARAAVVRSQIVRAYEILESIRFDFVSDTMFRDYIVEAKRQLEGAINDFLLSDKHHEESVDEMYKMGLEGYKKWLKMPMVISKAK